MRHSLVAVLTVLLAACATRCPPPETPPPPPPVTPVTDTVATISARYASATWQDLPGWPGDKLQTSWSAFLTSCRKLGNRSGWQQVCSDARALAPADDNTLRAFFEQRFAPWQIQAVTGDKPAVNSGLVTGYYEPLLAGGREEKPGRVPLYGVPGDLLTVDLASLFPELKGKRVRARVDGNRVVPYWTREEINAGKVAGNMPVLAWADDAIEAFFLQIQGSGRIRMDDGSVLRVGYADQNGHPYRAIGRWLADNGEMPIEQVSMQNIRAWALANPQRLPELLAVNPSFVFFRVLPDTGGGPIGALNVPLTDGASIAVDPKFIPLGSPVFIASTRPDNQQPLTRLVHAQDTGGAIRGPVRADFFWGFGAEAGALAGTMKQSGQLWLLWPNGLPLPDQK